VLIVFKTGLTSSVPDYIRYGSTEPRQLNWLPAKFLPFLGLQLFMALTLNPCRAAALNTLVPAPVKKTDAFHKSSLASASPYSGIFPGKYGFPTHILNISTPSARCAHIPGYGMSTKDKVV